MQYVGKHWCESLLPWNTISVLVGLILVNLSFGFWRFPHRLVDCRCNVLVSSNLSRLNFHLEIGGDTSLQKLWYIASVSPPLRASKFIKGANQISLARRAKISLYPTMISMHHSFLIISFAWLISSRITFLSHLPYIPLSSFPSNRSNPGGKVQTHLSASALHFLLSALNCVWASWVDADQLNSVTGRRKIHSTIMLNKSRACSMQNNPTRKTKEINNYVVTHDRQIYISVGK